MNCATHTETAAEAFCRTCGKAMCEACRQEWQGVVYCAGCAGVAQAAAVAAAPPGPVAADGPIPALAFFLGLIPGVGAIYNGQYGKGIIHVVVLGLLISIADSGAAGDMQPLFVMMTIAWFFYMALEAYHTAKRRLAGLPVDEFSSLFPPRRHPGRLPLGPLSLIALGVLFLLHTLGRLRLEQILKFWPVLLIAAGGYWLYARLGARSAQSAEPGGES